MQKARIRLTGTDFNKVEMVCDKIREIAERTGVNLAGPIPLPTKRLVVPIRKSPDGEGTASWDLSSCAFRCQKISVLKLY